LIAYENDDSSETQATIQKLKVSLQEAKDNLEETEYERYLSDQEQMLDSLVDDTQEWVNERLDNIDGLLREAIDSADTNASKIKDTLVEIASGFGISISDELGETLNTEDVDGQVVHIAENIVGVLDEIKDNIRDVVSTNPVDGKPVDYHAYAKGSRRIKNNEFAWTQENGTELIYRSSDGAMLTPLGQGDAVFTSAMTQRLWDIAQNPNIFGGLTTAAMPMGLVNNGATNDIRNDVEFNITMYGVNNPAEFAQQLKSAINNDTSVRKILQDTTIGQAMGRNSLNRLGR
jgi:hypothetical protein